MENRAYALITGLFILVLGVAVAAAALWLSDGAEAAEPYTVVAEGSVTGLVVNSNVLYRGVMVGQVDAIRFNQSDFDEILIDITVDADIPITTATYATLQLQGVTGFARVILNEDEEAEAGKPLQTSLDDPARIPMRPSLLDQVSDSGAELIQASNRLLDNLNALLSEGNRQRIARILSNVEAATGELASLQASIQPTLQRLPELTQQATETLERTNKLLGQLGELSGHVDELVQAAQRLGEVGAEAGSQLTSTVLPRLGDLLASLNRTTENLRRLTARLNENPESLLRGAPPVAPGPGEPGFERNP